MQIGKNTPKTDKRQILCQSLRITLIIPGREHIIVQRSQPISVQWDYGMMGSKIAILLLSIVLSSYCLKFTVSLNQQQQDIVINNQLGVYYLDRKPLFPNLLLFF
jgi:hypothetical protein